MKGGAVLIASMLGAAGCAATATTRTVNAPDGQPASSIECRQSESHCTREARRVCPGGYNVLDAKATVMMMDGVGSSRYEARMLIRCR
jgi:hypothetical protein